MSVVLLENWDQTITGSFATAGQGLCTPFTFATSDPTRLVLNTGGRFGTQRLQLQHNAGTVEWGRTDALVGSGVQEWIIGCAIHDSNITALVRPLLSLWDGTSVQINVVLNASEQIEIRRGTTVIATDASTAPHNQWYWLEVRIKIHSSSGEAEVRINESVRFNTGSLNTQNTANATADRVAVGGTVTSGSGGNPLLDDLYVIAKDGSGETDFLGDMSVVTLYPTSDASVQWTPNSGGTNYTQVDDVSPDSDTTYVSESTAGDIDRYGITDLSSSSETVFALEERVVWRMDDAGPRTARQLIRTGGTNYVGSTQSMSSSYVLYRGIRDRNPGTSNRWTGTEVNALEIGQELVS